MQFRRTVQNKDYKQKTNDAYIVTVSGINTWKLPVTVADIKKCFRLSKVFIDEYNDDNAKDDYSKCQAYKEPV